MQLLQVEQNAKNTGKMATNKTKQKTKRQQKSDDHTISYSPMCPQPRQCNSNLQYGVESVFGLQDSGFGGNGFCIWCWLGCIWCWFGCICFKLQILHQFSDLSGQADQFSPINHLQFIRRRSISVPHLC